LCSVYFCAGCSGGETQLYLPFSCSTTRVANKGAARILFGREFFRGARFPPASDRGVRGSRGTCIHNRYRRSRSGRYQPLAAGLGSRRVGGLSACRRRVPPHSERRCSEVNTYFAQGKGLQASISGRRFGWGQDAQHVGEGKSCLSPEKPAVLRGSKKPESNQMCRQRLTSVSFPPGDGHCRSTDAFGKLRLAYFQSDSQGKNFLSTILPEGHGKRSLAEFGRHRALAVLMGRRVHPKGARHEM
jgi:hypothetical protein